MAPLARLTFVFILFIRRALGSEVFTVLREVQHCFNTNPEPCLVDHAVQVLLNLTHLPVKSTLNKTEEGRSSLTIEEKLASNLAEAVGVSDADLMVGLDVVQRGRADPVLRTFQRAWKYMIPFLIGVKLKMATFVPMVLTVLTLIAKSAFFSGHLALLLTGLNIALKFWYPKWSEEHHVYQETHSHHIPHGEYPNGEGHQQSQNFQHNFEHPYKALKKFATIEYGRTF